MSDTHKKSRSGTSPPRPAPPPREFAFSRVAGASLTEYAPVSSLAVAALVLCILGLPGVLWPWWLLAPGLSLFLAGLSLYYIATSAGTLTGRKIALTAVMISLTLGLAGGLLHLRDYRQQQRDIREVRVAAEAVRLAAEAGDFQALYRQLAPGLRDAIPPSYWEHECRRLLGQWTRPSRVELTGGIFPSPTGAYVATLRLYLPGPRGEQVLPIRLIYARIDDALLDDATRARLAEEGIQPGDWQVLKEPPFIQPLPPCFPEPLIWPGPGAVLRVTTRPDGRLGQSEPVERSARAPQGYGPTTIIPSDGGRPFLHYATTQRDSFGRAMVAEEPLPDLVPPPVDRVPWLRDPASRNRR